MLDPRFDQEFREFCGGHICGVDEAGRGPLAGPVYAAAVILSPERPIEGLNDSKKLSEKKREILFDEIIEKAEAYAIASASVEEIEQSVQNSLDREVSSTRIGELVMDKLKDIDEVAYVRFASVYRQFKDINTFMSELSKLLSN